MKFKKFLLAAIIVVSIFCPQVILIYSSPILFITLLLVDKKAICIIKNKTILFLFVVLVMVQPFLIGSKDYVLFGLGISSVGFISGLSMFIRGVLVISAFQTINRNLPKESVFGFWKIIGVMNFDEVFDAAKSIFPKIKERTVTAVSQRKKITAIKSPLTLIAEVIALTMNEAHSAEVHNSRGNEL